MILTKTLKNNKTNNDKNNNNINNNNSNNNNKQNFIFYCSNFDKALKVGFWDKTSTTRLKGKD